MLYRLFLPLALFFTAVGAVPNSGPNLSARPIAVADAETEADSPAAERRSEHFLFLYDPKRLTPSQLEEAVREAETSFKEMAALFPEVNYTEPIIIRLDARFRGATGYAAPGGKSGKGKQDAIGLRYEDLPTLGLSPAFLFRHEFTHLFAGRWENGQPNRALSGSALGEGLADLTADGRNRLGLPLSFAKYLQVQDAWVSPERLFLHPPDPRPPIPKDGWTRYDDIFRWRITRYVQPSLFLKYVQSRIGWGKMRAFYIDYSKAARTKTPADDIRTVFRRHLGVLPEEFFEQWQAAIDSAPEEREENRQRYLSERAYAAVQWYEFLVAAKKIPESRLGEIDALFRALHANVAARKLDAAEEQLEQVMERVRQSMSEAPAETII